MTEPLAAIYVRVSTEEQAKGFSLTTQRDACQALAAREGFAIPDQYIIADDVTGETLNRPGLKTLRTLVASKAVAAVLIYDLDRLSRRMAHQLLLEDEFESAGVQLLVVTDPLEAGPEGVLRRHVKGVLAEYEKAKILRRTGDGRIGRVKAGYPTIGAGVPLGYDYIRGSPDRTVRGSLVINVDEAEIVRRIFELCLQGLGIWAIARRLTAEGILTKRDRQRRSGKTQAAGVWSPSSVRQVLRNETYAGVLYYNKSERMIPEPQRRRNPLNLPDAKTTIRRRARTDWLSSPCPTIIDRETWERVQGQIRHNAAKNTRSRRSEYLLLAGRLRYGYCGMALVGYTDRRKNVRCYRCNSQQNHTQEVCRGSIRADVIEGRVWTIVELLLMEPATIERLIARRQTQVEPEREGLEQSLARTAAHMAALEKEARQWDRAYAAGAISLEHFKRLRHELNERQAALERSQQEFQAELARVGAIDAEATRLRAAVAQSVVAPMKTIPERRAILDALDVVVVCKFHEQPIQTRSFFSIDLDPEHPGSHAWQGAASLRPLRTGSLGAIRGRGSTDDPLKSPHLGAWIV